MPVLLLSVAVCCVYRVCLCACACAVNLRVCVRRHGITTNLYFGFCSATILSQSLFLSILHSQHYTTPHRRAYWRAELSTRQPLSLPSITSMNSLHMFTFGLPRTPCSVDMCGGAHSHTGCTCACCILSNMVPNARMPTQRDAHVLATSRNTYKCGCTATDGCGCSAMMPTPTPAPTSPSPFIRGPMYYKLDGSELRTRRLGQRNSANMR